MNSNYTLRFPRTSREAYGYDIELGRQNPDRFGFLVYLALAFLFGLLLGGL
jgi:hypothetical protein